MRFVKLMAVVTMVLGAMIAYKMFSDDRSPLKPDSYLTRDFVVAHVPLGTTVERAREYMNNSGLTCYDYEKQRFSAGSSVGNVPEGKADFTLCDSGERGFLITKRWQIIFINERGKVAGITVDAGLTGP